MIGESFRPTESLLRALSGAPILVGTQNPAKLEAIRNSFAAFAEPGVVLDLVSVAVASGVSEQPIGYDEIVTGARNRACAAFEAGNGVIAVGIEDGLLRFSAQDASQGRDAAGGRDGAADSQEGEELADNAYHSAYYNVGCAWVTDGERVGHGFSAGFSYPPDCLEPAVRDQAPIGELFDELWRLRREEAGSKGRDQSGESVQEPPQEPAMLVASGRQGGNIGRLTQGRLGRSAYGGQAVTCALIRFLHTDLYD